MTKLCDTKGDLIFADDTVSITSQESSTYVPVQKLLLQAMLHAKDLNRMDIKVSKVELEDTLRGLIPEANLGGCTGAQLYIEWRRDLFETR